MTTLKSKEITITAQQMYNITVYVYDTSTKQGLAKAWIAPNYLNGNPAGNPYGYNTNSSGYANFSLAAGTYQISIKLPETNTTYPYSPYYPYYVQDNITLNKNIELSAGFEYMSGDWIVVDPNAAIGNEIGLGKCTVTPSTQQLVTTGTTFTANTCTGHTFQGWSYWYGGQQSVTISTEPTITLTASQMMNTYNLPAGAEITLTANFEW